MSITDDQAIDQEIEATEPTELAMISVGIFTRTKPGAEDEAFVEARCIYTADLSGAIVTHLAAITGMVLDRHAGHSNMPTEVTEAGLVLRNWAEQYGVRFDDNNFDQPDIEVLH